MESIIIATQSGDVAPQEIENEINNLCDYLNIVLEYLDVTKKLYPNQHVLFRGQANSSFGVEPSIFRDGLLLKETRLSKELALQAPEDFKQSASTFEKLIKMQHYGLPTRLLDVTLNPLVALYFACCEEGYINDDGEILVVLDYLTQPDEQKVYWISSMAEYEGSSEEYFYDFCVSRGLLRKKDDSNNKNTIKRMLSDRFLAVASPKNNERIRRQQGAFLLLGVELDSFQQGFEKSSYDIKQDLLKLNTDGVQRSLIIPTESKLTLLRQLDGVGINEAFLFPELEHQTAYIKKKHKIAKASE